jgi:methyl-accepting chemotaxis protein
MNRIAPAGGRPDEAAHDGAWLRSVHDRLDQARTEIEDRFLAGGDALVLAHENIQQLIQALDRIAHSLDDETASRALEKLGDATLDLQRRIDSEQGRQEELDEVLRKKPELIKNVGQIRATLGHLNACAAATRITGAGNAKFVAFGHEISSYVQKAEQEIAHFSHQVDLICQNLEGVGKEGKQSLAVLLDAVPAASEKLLEAAEAIDRRMSDMRELATRAAPLMRAVEAKFAATLTALQIGDVTRQRIEHVQAGVRDLLALRPEADGSGLRGAALRLFDAQTASLTAEFDSGARRLIEALAGLGADARTILDLHRAAGQPVAHAQDPLAVARNSLESMRQIVADVERVSTRSANADATIRRLAAELLDHAGEIGNLSNVRRDIGLLALNAHLHCSRMGELGRAVSAIAAEIKASSDRLGGSTEAVLRCMGEIRNRSSHLDGGEAGGDLVADLDEVGAALDGADRQSRETIALVSSRGETIVSRIVAAAQNLDFSLRLGEQLAACSAALRKASADCGSCAADPAQLQAFSQSISKKYTMKIEREIHYEIFKTLITLEQPENEDLDPNRENADQDDECFL